MHMLHDLDLRNCCISTVSKNTFENLPNLEKLFLSHNSIEIIRNGTFDKLGNLIHLDLSYNNFIKHSATFPDPFSEYFSGLVIHEKVFENVKNLVFLDLSHSKLVQKSVKSFKWLPATLEQLSLCYSNIPFIMDGMFNESKLKILDLSGNNNLVSYLKYYSFEDLKETLEVLVFRNSSVKSLKYFSSLHKLRMLDLRYNNINELQLNNLRELTELEILDLGSNHISTWFSRIFENNQNLSVINLRNNNINYLTNWMLKDFSLITFIAIGGNNFVCDCVLRTFFEMAAQNAMKLYCLSAAETDKENDEMSSSDEFLAKNSSHRKLVYPYNVFSRQYRRYMKYMDNSAKNLQKSAISTNFNKIEPYESNIKTDISINCDGFIDHNEEFDPDFENLFVLIDYSKQDYRCHEPTQNNEFYFDAVPPCKKRVDTSSPDDSESETDVDEATTNTETSFTDKSTERADYTVNDPLDVEKVIAIVVLFVIILVIIYFWKRKSIKYFFILFRNSLILSFPNDSSNDQSHLLTFTRKRKTNNRDFLYDVFVSYSDKDRDWILNNLLPNIEKRSEINVCLHERDFQVTLKCGIYGVFLEGFF